MPIILRNLPTKPHDLTLIIANRRYSSWSLRAWLAAKQSLLTFKVKLIPFAPDYAACLSEYAPARTVPILVDNGLVVAQSVAIGLHLHNLNPDAGIIPNDPQKAAICYDLSCEMISSFRDLRINCPMDLQLPLQNTPDIAGVKNDIARLQAIWNRARNQFAPDGAFLLGEFSLADAMFAPVATRCRTYQIPLDAVSQTYCDNLLNHPWFLEWEQQGLSETYDYH